jgi:hypothetical protein
MVEGVVGLSWWRMRMTEPQQPENSPKKSDSWYVRKQPAGHCEIVQGENPIGDVWGPYGSQQEAIAKRVGLIRAGKCRPV